jgi:hypothetical protein
VLVGQRQRVGAVAGFQHFDVRVELFQHLPHGFADQLVIINDQYLQRAASLWSAVWSAAAVIGYQS